MQDRADVGKTEKGRRLIVLRTARGLEQKDLAHRSRVHQSTVSAIEQGRQGSGLETWERLLEALGSAASGMQRAGWLIQGAFLDTEEPGSRAEKAAGRVTEGLCLIMEDQVLAGVAQRGAPAPVEPAGAVEHWETLCSFSADNLRRIIEDSAALQSPAFFEALCAESVKRTRRDPRAATALAELALDMAAWAPLADEQQRPEYQAYALAVFANANRAQGFLPEAKEAFRKSASLWQPGSPAQSPLDGTRILDLRASLFLAERRLPEALALLDRAWELGPKGSAARARILILKAKAHEELKQPEVALGLLEQAEPLLDQEPDPFLVYSHRSVLLVNLWLAGRPEEAERRLGELQALAEELGNDLDKLRLRWLEARIDAALDRRLAAIEKMRGVRADFQERKIPFDTALATLELSALLLEQGETAEVKELAEEMLATFAEQEVPQEAEKALRIFCDAAIQETVTVDLVRRVLAEVERG